MDNKKKVPMSKKQILFLRGTALCVLAALSGLLWGILDSSFGGLSKWWMVIPFTLVTAGFVMQMIALYRARPSTWPSYRSR